jgi:hypothetical protein
VRFASGAAIPNGKCFVYLTGTSTLAALFNSSGGSIANPALASSVAQVGFAAANGIYDLQPAYPDGTPAGPKILAQQIFDLSTFDGVPADSVGAVFDNVTDDHVGILASAAKIKALAGNRGGGGFYPGGPKMKLPAGKTGYMGTTTLEIDWTGRLGGHGSGRWGPAGRGASALRWAGGAVGIIVQHPDTTGTIGESAERRTTVQAASASTIS